MKNIIFIAPPAAGKGTVSDYLVKNYHYEHLSTGDLLREEIQNGSELGKSLEEIMASGKLVSDDIILQLVETKLQSYLQKPFILDGFPRTLVQAEALEKMLLTLGVTNNIAIYLDIPKEEAIKRVTGRIVCPKCKRSYNLNHEELKPKKDNLCDDCMVELEKRSDDNIDTFAVRFDAYLENTSPILDFYASRKMLKKVDAMTQLNEMFQNIIEEAKND